MCGLSGILTVNNPASAALPADIDKLENMARLLANRGASSFEKNRENGQESPETGGPAIDADTYLGGKQHIEELAMQVRSLKRNEPFFQIYTHPQMLNLLESIAGRISGVIEAESRWLDQHMGRVTPEAIAVMAAGIEKGRHLEHRLLAVNIDHPHTAMCAE